MDPALRLEKLRRTFDPCVQCPRACRARRLQDEVGECGVGRHALVSSYGPHFGEEPVLVGTRGSGTVFFAGCNLRCVYCQNYEISQWRLGNPVGARELAAIFLRIQAMGCHNLNLVTPSHVVYPIVEALELARAEGFRLPVVYNTSAYDSVATLQLLDGLVDIYMPDTKYMDPEKAARYSGRRDYPRVMQKALKEMHRQVGDLVIRNGLAVRGLLVRHLVLPNGLSDTRRVIDFLVEEISPDTYLNLMDQYYPTYQAHRYPELSRRITAREYREAVEYALNRGIHRGIPFEDLKHARFGR